MVKIGLSPQHSIDANDGSTIYVPPPRRFKVPPETTKHQDLANNFHNFKFEQNSLSEIELKRLSSPMLALKDENVRHCCGVETRAGIRVF